MTINEQIGTMTSVLGTATTLITSYHSILGQIYVKPNTGTTTFDIKLTDAHGNDILTRTDDECQ